MIKRKYIEETNMKFMARETRAKAKGNVAGYLIFKTKK